MWWRNKYQAFFRKAKIEHISGSAVRIFIQFVLLHLNVGDYHNVLKSDW